MYISYDYYRVFFYVAKYRSFTQAAHLLMNNQPNITRTIKKLEHELGCALFIRSNRGVALTPEGEKLYAHIQIAMEQIQSGEDELMLDRTLESGTISIGVSEVALRCFLLPILKRYRTRCPKVRLRISNHSTPQAIAALKDGASDIALVTTPADAGSGLQVRKLKEIQEVAVCSTAYPALQNRTCSLSDLTTFPLISLGKHTGTYQFYTDWFLQNGLDFKPNMEAATADQILPMVRNDLGVGFVPQDFLQDERTDQVFPLRLKEAIPPRSICLIKRAGQALSIAAKALESMILEQVL